MKEQVEEIQENPRVTFFQKFGPFIAAACGLLSILFLLGTVVTFKVKVPVSGGDTVKIATDVHLWNYFEGKYTYDWTIFVTIGLLFIGCVVECLQKIRSGFGSAATMIFFLCIPLLALTREFFAGNDIENLSSVSFGWGGVCSLALSICAAVLCLSTEFSYNRIAIRQIAEDGILISAAFILNVIKIPIAAGAGSINLQMLPLFIIALRHGPTHGLACGGILYGLITCLTDGWGFSTYPFDYLIGFGSVMVLGYLRKFILSPEQKWYNVKGEIFLFIGGMAATLIRFIGSTASSMIIYNYSFQAAIAYNITYIPLSGLVSIALIMFAYGPLLNVHHQFPIQKTL